MSAKLKIKQAILVEGKYDKIKLQQLVDAPIFTPTGFPSFHPGKRQSCCAVWHFPTA